MSLWREHFFYLPHTCRFWICELFGLLLFIAFNTESQSEKYNQFIAVVTSSRSTAVASAVKIDGPSDILQWLSNMTAQSTFVPFLTHLYKLNDNSFNESVAFWSHLLLWMDNFRLFPECKSKSISGYLRFPLALTIVSHKPFSLFHHSVLIRLFLCDDTVHCIS